MRFISNRNGSISQHKLALKYFKVSASWKIANKYAKHTRKKIVRTNRNK